MYGYIYLTINITNNRKYIGQHHSSVFDKSYKGSGKILQLAIEKYGWDNFKTEIIEECESKEELNDREIYWIAFYNAQTSSEFYNICKGGDAGPGGPMMKGKRHSNATRQKMSESKRGSLNSNYGNHWKMSESQLERRRELSSGENNPMYGKTHSTEVRAIIKEKATGRIWMTNGVSDKHIDPDEYDRYLSLGFIKGRTYGIRKSSSETIESIASEKDTSEEASRVGLK